MNTKLWISIRSKTLYVMLLTALLATSLAVVLPPRPVYAATFVVNTIADTDDANPGDGVCADGSGNCSLRAAISEANALAGADVITLPAGTYVLTLTGHSENSNATGDLDLTSDITINGAGADVTVIDGNQTDRVLHVLSGATVELNDLTITNGRAPDSDTVHCRGGGLYNNSGTLTMRDSVVSNNTSGSYSTGGCDGGGLYIWDGSTLIERSVIRGNTAGDGLGSSSFGGDGGGIAHVWGGTVTIRSSSISDNQSGNGIGADGTGGGIHFNASAMTIENSTISGNAAKGRGGGIRNQNDSHAVTLIHCTITENIGDADNDDSAQGGGIAWRSGTGAGFSVKNTIIIGNVDEGYPGQSDCYGDVGYYTSQGYNLVGSDTGCPSGGTGDQTTTDAKLGPLQDNGGPTETHAPAYDSPAVEVIPSGTNGCGTDYITDQRGEVRPGGGLCDVGAYESPYIFWDADFTYDGYVTIAENWSGDTLPAVTDVPVFSYSPQSALINTDLTVAGWIIDSAYTDIIDLQPGQQLTVNGDWQQAGGIFQGDNNSVLDINGAFDLSGGTFRAPYGTGLMSVDGGFHHTGGTFDPRDGRVVLDNTTDQTLATTFNDLYLNDGLLGYWKLDEGSGTTTADTSGYGHAGTLNGGPAWVTDTAATIDFYDPYALHLERSPADYVSIAGTSAIDDLQQLTLSAWVRLDTTPADTNMRFMTLRNEKAVLRYEDVGGVGKLNFYMNIGGSLRSYLVDHTWTTDTWVHVAGTYDGSTMRLYLNGTEQGAPVAVSGAVGAGDGIHLGWSGSDGALDGMLDDVRVYNRALSDAEIVALAAGAHPQTSLATTTLGAPLDVNGDLVLNSGTLDVSTSNYSINIAGDLVRNGGVFNARSGAVTFDGSGEQALNTDALTFHDLTVNSSSTLVDLAEFTVADTLTNNGALQRTQDVNGAADVPFFNTGGYGGLILNANNSDLGSTTVTIRGNQDCTTTSGETVQRCFNISPANTSGRNATVTFYFGGSELSGNTCSALDAYHWNGSTWDALTTGARGCSAEPYWLQATGVNSFSPFTLKASSAPTSIIVHNLAAQTNGNSIAFMLALCALAAWVGIRAMPQRRRRN